jgi:hypothetical protein
MAKSKKLRRVKPRHSKRLTVSPTNKSEAALDNDIVHLKALVTWILLSLVTVILISIGVTYMQGFSREEIYQRVPLALRIIFIVSMSLLTAKATVFALEHYSGRRTVKYQAKLALLDFIASVFILSVVVLVFAYLYGIPDKISAWLKILLPNIGEQIRNSVSTVLSWIAAGIIGNAAFAMLKRAASWLIEIKQKKTVRK